MAKNTNCLEEDMPTVSNTDGIYSMRSIIREILPCSENIHVTVILTHRHYSQNVAPQKYVLSGFM